MLIQIEPLGQPHGTDQQLQLTPGQNILSRHPVRLEAHIGFLWTDAGIAQRPIPLKSRLKQCVEGSVFFPAPIET